jgi:myo-inositol-1(or 4)-monophosphatase
MPPSLHEVEHWAKQAGTLLKTAYGKPHQIQHKGRIDLVTETDKQSEKLLLDLIRGKYPEHTIITEESGLLNEGSPNCWYIDPLDGTTNFAHQMPFFAVSLGYAEWGRMKFGVVYDPMREECYSAEKGKGAWLNRTPIRVSDIDNLIDCLLVTGFPYILAPGLDNNMEYFARFGRLTQGPRRMGSAALDLCYVGAGRFDGFWEVNVKAWDYAAGKLIVEEAGGIVTDFAGDEHNPIIPNSLIAANPIIHSQMLAVIQEITAAVKKDS